MAAVTKISDLKTNQVHESGAPSVHDFQELLFLVTMASYVNQLHELVMRSWSTFGDGVAQEMQENRKARTFRQKRCTEETQRAERVFQEKREKSKLLAAQRPEDPALLYRHLQSPV